MDKMHQVALGVARVVLDLLRKEIKIQMRGEVTRNVSKIKLIFLSRTMEVFSAVVIFVQTQLMKIGFL